MKWFLLTSCVLALGACTKDMDTAMFYAKQELAAYNPQPMYEFLGFDHVFQVSESKSRRALAEACLENAENRVIISDAFTEPQHYRQCAYTPSPVVRQAPQRYE